MPAGCADVAEGKVRAIVGDASEIGRKSKIRDFATSSAAVLRYRVVEKLRNFLWWSVGGCSAVTVCVNEYEEWEI